MRIKYLRIHSNDGHSHPDDGTEIFLENDKVNFFDYEYIKEIRLFDRLSKQGVNWFIRHVKIIKKSSTKKSCEHISQSILKLIYLRKDLVKSKFFNVPLFFSPDGECLTGDGRALICTFYVPDIKFDCIFFKKKYNQGIKFIEKLVTDIAEHKKYSLEEKTILMALHYKDISNDCTVGYTRNLEFVDNYVYDQRLFDNTMGYYLSFNNLDRNLWEEAYQLIKSYPIKNIEDYVDLLNKLTSIPIV